MSAQRQGYPFNAHKMKPNARGLGGFAFAASRDDQRFFKEPANLSSSYAVQNVVQVIGPDTGKPHHGKVFGILDFTQHRKRVRFYSKCELVNALEHDKS